jgi:hypothetical protein
MLMSRNIGIKSILTKNNENFNIIYRNFNHDCAHRSSFILFEEPNPLFHQHHIPLI